MNKSFFTKWSFLFKIRLFFGVFLFIIIGAFLYFKVVPFGQITYSRTYPEFIKSGKGFIYGFTPTQRVDLKSGTYPKLSGDPVYFSVFTPRTFDQAKLTITYRNNLSAPEPIIEAGVLTDKIVWHYDLKPVQNDVIDNLKKSWSVLKNGSKILLQKNNTYSSWADLEADLNKGTLKDCPGGINACLATYNYEIPSFYQPADFRNSLPLVIDTPLRGAHQLYIYLNNAPLHLEFSFINLRQDKVADPITVNLYDVNDHNKLIVTKYLADDRKDLNAPTADSIAEKIIIDENLKNGLYKVEIKVRDDTVIKRIESSADKLVFINKVWPVSASLPLSLWTDAPYLQAKLYSPASRQTINFSGEDFILDKAYEQTDLIAHNPTSTAEIKLVKDDVILENNGVFAFSKGSLFNPVPKKIDRFFKLNNNIKYVLADYEAPLSYTEPEFKTQTVELNTKAAYREAGKYSFMLSIPGLKSSDISGDTASSADNLEIKEIKIDFSGRTLWQKLFALNN